MKHLTLIAILVFSFSIKLLSQERDRSSIYIKELSSEGIKLDKGWTFFPGDNPDYAKYYYADERGIPVNPTLVLGQLPLVRRAGIGWFRLKFEIDSSLRDKTIGMMISQFGATEIYLNGELILRLGKVSKNYKEEKTQAIYAHAVNLKLGAGKEQLLAVRYSYNQQNMYRYGFTVPPCFRIVLRPSNENINKMALMAKHIYLPVGITLTIVLAASIITLFFYFSFPLRKEYLYFGLYFVCQFFGMLIQSNFLAVGKNAWLSANEIIFIIIIVNVFFIPASLLSVYGLHILFKSRNKKFYRFLQLYGITSLAAMFFLSGPVVMISILFFPLICVEIMCASYRAARRKISGVWIIFLAALIALILLIFLIQAIVVNEIEFTTLMICLSVLVFAMGIVMFLAGDFANTSLALRLRIAEVEDLSKKSLAQEKEKQEILTMQKDTLETEVEERTMQLRKSLNDLKSTQAQLIQSEKMASLGELTAGIAHEIQNPLNFVNNFSEVSNELIDEMKDEIKKGNYNEVSAIAEDVKQNLEKINHHGKRAGDIVKGMLQHSRQSSGKKEPTDINTLCDEYLRLSYHGLRAKDKSFNAAFETNFDSTLPKLNVIPQDLGRVLLNIINNAFYAVNEKRRIAGENYKPLVSVQTKKINDTIEISVEDNGNGIPESIKEKIFQPFFTTKPTGQGTGLGLSLAYDIVKAHGGTTKIESPPDERAGRKGEGSIFIIQLPITV